MLPNIYKWQAETLARRKHLGPRQAILKDIFSTHKFYNISSRAPQIIPRFPQINLLSWLWNKSERQLWVLSGILYARWRNQHTNQKYILSIKFNKPQGTAHMSTWITVVFFPHELTSLLMKQKMSWFLFYKTVGFWVNS